ncbi:hypothetical protein COO91_02605 [Nostoc flagelliforme CCNUN1]|uniref:Uncharacterized protein n=1 Tax=Nostoc flagelliforme CCNUN1 TaxID=2038116 RepID=A0A2K8SMI0_9NOSO|nr:hypothetical protein COO91_02605 [Nostoc flagelliforme CCNUN1]
MSPINLRVARSHFLTQQSNNNHSHLSDRHLAVQYLEIT